MKSLIKVIETKTYQNTLVCKGELVLIELDNSQKEKAFQEGQIVVFINNKTFKPYIISKREEVEVEDNIVCSVGFGKLIEKDGDDYTTLIGDTNWIAIKEECKKVLVLPENFSSKNLQDIANGDFKNGDAVFVECYEGADCGSSNCRNGCASVLNGGDWCSGYYTSIKLNKENHINLFPVKKDESLEQLVKIGIERERLGLVDKEENWDDVFENLDVFIPESLKEKYFEIRDKLKENYNPPTKI